MYRELFKKRTLDFCKKSKKDILSISFFKSEPQIQNSKLFWILYPAIHQNLSPETNPISKDVMDEMFYRYDRLDSTLEERQKMIVLYHELNHTKGDIKPQRINKKLWEYLKKFDDDDDVILYRGFSIAENQDVRIGRKKLDNENAYRQQSGCGFCYTMDEDIALWFAHRLYMIDGKFSCCRVKFDNHESGIERDMVIIDDGGILEGNKTIIDTSLVDIDSRRVVAKYSVKKRDILFYVDNMNEREIVVMPETTKLISYKLSRPKIITGKPSSTKTDERDWGKDIGYWEDYEKDKVYQLIKSPTEKDFIRVESNLVDGRFELIDLDKMLNDM